MCEKIVLTVKKSQNSKTGPVSCTYAPIQSCPKTCPFMDSGCYAQHGHSGIHLRRINKNASKYNKTRPIDIARIEAKSIKELDSDRPLRLHIVGDCKTPKAAYILSLAAKEYSARTGQKVWTYTHAWKTIPREKWGDISVLASCESIEDAKHAIDRGYAASLVRAKPFYKPFSYKGVKMMPCLQITQGIQCNKCKVCMNDYKLRNEKKVICFFPHGSGKEVARKAIFKHRNNFIGVKKVDSKDKEFLSDGKAHQKKFKQDLSDGSFWS